MAKDAVGDVGVSRETIERLECFCDLVLKWTTKINLISPSTVPNIWDRHVVDSAQLFALSPPGFLRWVDLGSGGGFPGVIIATMAKELNPIAAFSFVESDQRKATFLRTAVRELGLDVTVFADRIEAAPPQKADVVSARALSSLYGVLPLIERHLLPDGTALLHKGRRFGDEVEEARSAWRFGLEAHPSLTDPDARLLAITGISRIGQ